MMNRYSPCPTSCSPLCGLGSLLAVVGLLSLALVANAAAPSQGVERRVASLRIPFVAHDDEATFRFSAATFAGTVRVERDGALAYLVRAADGRQALVRERVAPGVFAPEGQEPSATRVHVLRGKDRAGWQRDLAAFSRVSYGEIQPGVDLALVARQANVEKVFTVAAGTAPTGIEVRVEGAQLALTSEGLLELRSPAGVVAFTPPVAYQEVDEARRTVEVRYALRGSDRYGFEVGPHDSEHALVIDPLFASTFVGAGNPDYAFAVAYDRQGRAYIAGQAAQGIYGDYPSTTGAYQETNAGGSDVVVSWLSADLTQLLASTFVGGSGGEGATALAVDYSAGGLEPSIVVAGSTNSADFPTSVGAFDTSLGGPHDVFVLRLGHDLATLEASTYLGGSNIEVAFEPNTDRRGPSLAVAPDGSVYAAGTTSSSDFPTTPPATGRLPYQASKAGDDEVYIARLSSGLDALLAGTYLGGGENDRGTGIGLDASGRVFVTGHTESAPGWRPPPYEPFPIIAGAYDETFNSAGGVLLEDGFVSRLDANLQFLERSSFIGGSSSDLVWTLVVEPGSADVYIAGDALSTDYPTTPGAYDPVGLGAYSGFISRLDADLATLEVSTFLGGAASDNRILAIDLDTDGDVWATGYTWASDFPVTVDLGDPDLPPYYDPINYSNKDVFLSRLAPDLDVLKESYHFGGSGPQEAWGIIAHTEVAYFAGWTETGRPRDWSYPVTPGAYDIVADDDDAFVTILPEPACALGVGIVALAGLATRRRATTGDRDPTRLPIDRAES